jgi:uncharacterized protein YciI
MPALSPSSSAKSEQVQAEGNDMQFVVTALDFTDADALQRRLSNREAHIAGARKLIADKRFISGGAILDDAGRMIGSTLHVDFPDRESLEQYLQQDPYVSGKVWEKIDISPVRLLPLDI